MRRTILSIACLALFVGACAPSSPPATKKAAGPDVPVIVWSSRDLPPGLDARLTAIHGVRSISPVFVGVVNLIRVRGSTAPLPHRRKGGILPIAIAAMAPGAGTTDVLSQTIASGKAALTHTSAALRHMGVGGTLTVASGAVRRAFTVGAVVPDDVGRGKELIVPASGAKGLGLTGTRSIITWIAADGSTETIDAIRRATGGVLARVHVGLDTPPDPAEGPTLSFADVKRIFGEFTFKPRNGLYVAVDRSWMDAFIVKTRVPVLGLITCNRRLLPQLTGAMRELQARGLAGLVRTSNGCFSPRMQVGNSYELSRHAYGIAVDINAGTNRYGDPPAQDPRLVEVMQRWGFTWGGRWLIPDGMHFEFVRFVSKP